MRPFMLAIACVVTLSSAACYREGPPEIPDYIPPVIKPVVQQVAKVETVEETPSVVEMAQPPPAPTPKMEASKATPPEAKPVEKPTPPKPESVEPKAPSIVGTWHITEMSQNGQAMPPGITMEFTFGEDGSMSMNMSAPQMPEPQSKSGTYSVSGDQITISIDRETKTGTLTFEGPNRAVIEVDRVRFTMEK